MAKQVTIHHEYRDAAGTPVTAGELVFAYEFDWADGLDLIPPTAVSAPLNGATTVAVAPLPLRVTERVDGLPERSWHVWVWDLGRDDVALSDLPRSCDTGRWGCGCVPSTVGVPDFTVADGDRRWGSALQVMGHTSGALPQTPADGDLWIVDAPLPAGVPPRLDGSPAAAGDGVVWSARAGRWLNVGPIAVPGPKGDPGPPGADSTVPGPKGDPGPPGAGVPSGGADRQVLTIAAGTPTWQDPAEELPPIAGHGGDVLAVDQAGAALEWRNPPHDIPTGGDIGQVLAKASNSNRDVHWVSVSSALQSVNVPDGTVLAAGQYWGVDVVAPAGFTSANTLPVCQVFFDGATGLGVSAATAPVKLRPIPVWWPAAGTVRVGIYSEAAYTFPAGYCRIFVLFHRLGAGSP